MRVRLSAKHGLNPTLPTCFWCGEATGDVALLGASYSGEAPRHMVMNYEPCATCKAKFASGILLIEATQTPIKGHPAIQEGVWPTGRFAVITAESLGRVFEPIMVEALKKHNRGFIDVQTFTHLFTGGVDEQTSDTGA